LIRALLRLYRARFRQRFGGSILAFHRDRVRDGMGPGCWVRVVFDHLVSADGEHARAWSVGGRGVGERGGRAG
jgi:hypothetical protein